MGHKVNPKVFRIGFAEDWRSRWFAPRRRFRDLLKQDVVLRRMLRQELREAGLSKVEVERSRNKVTVTLFTSKPGVIIGRGGSGIEKLTKMVREALGPDVADVKLNVQEVERPGLEAELVVQAAVSDLERRLPFRQVMRQAVERAMRAGAQGVKVAITGRLNGSEYARRETAAEGKIPLHTLRADIDYARGAARTSYGAIGVKVWIYRGEVFSRGVQREAAQ
jgi:small subunit ribosomal protein S3